MYKSSQTLSCFDPGKSSNERFSPIERHLKGGVVDSTGFQLISISADIKLLLGSLFDAKEVKKETCQEECKLSMESIEKLESYNSFDRFKFH